MSKNMTTQIQKISPGDIYKSLRQQKDELDAKERYKRSLEKQASPAKNPKAHGINFIDMPAACCASVQIQTGLAFSASNRIDLQYTLVYEDRALFLNSHISSITDQGIATICIENDSQNPQRVQIVWSAALRHVGV